MLELDGVKALHVESERHWQRPLVGALARPNTQPAAALPLRTHLEVIDRIAALGADLGLGMSGEAVDIALREVLADAWAEELSGTYSQMLQPWTGPVPG